MVAGFSMAVSTSTSLKEVGNGFAGSTFWIH